MGIAKYHFDNATFSTVMTSQGPMWVAKQNRGLRKEYRDQKRREAVERQMKNIERGYSVINGRHLPHGDGAFINNSPKPIEYFDGSLGYTVNTRASS